MCMALGCVQYLCVFCVESSGTCPSVCAAPCLYQQLTGRNAEHLCCHTLPRASQEVKWEGLWMSMAVGSLVCVYRRGRWYTYPTYCLLRRVVSISGALKAHSTAVALRFIQRRILMSDPNWLDRQSTGRPSPRFGCRMQGIHWQCVFALWVNISSIIVKG